MSREKSENLENILAAMRLASEAYISHDALQDSKPPSYREWAWLEIFYLLLYLKSDV